MKKNNITVKISLVRIILSVLAVNVVGLVLRYFDYDTFIIILGFRFHLSFILPLLIIYPPNLVAVVKDSLISPSFKRKFLPVIWVLLSFGLIIAALFLLEKSELSDPDYFYEFGLSSIVDYPIYLIWNSPQFLALFVYLLFCTDDIKNKLFPVFGLIFFLFLYEFIPLDIKEFDFAKINYFPFAELFLFSISVGLFFHFFRNVYWFPIVFFSALWLNLLAFGSGSQTLINLLFAAQYNEWEGFFIVNKDFSPYLLLAQLIIFLLALLISLPLRTKQIENTDLQYSFNQSQPDA